MFNESNLTRSSSSSSFSSTKITSPGKSLGILSAIGHPSTVTLTIISLILNSIVVVVLFRKRRQQQQQLKQQQQRPKAAFIHLLCLTLSDLALGIVFLCGAVWFCVLSGGAVTAGVSDAALTAIALPQSFEAAYVAFFYFLCAVIGNVRWLTLYITLVRAKAVAGIKGNLGTV